MPDFQRHLVHKGTFEQTKLAVQRQRKTQSMLNTQKPEKNDNFRATQKCAYCSTSRSIRNCRKNLLQVVEQFLFDSPGIPQH